IYLILAIAGLFLLAVSLDDLRFQEGAPIPAAPGISAPAASDSPDGQPMEAFMLPWILKALLSLGILAVVVNILIAILRNTNLKKLLLLAGILGALILGGYILSTFEIGAFGSEFQPLPPSVATQPAVAAGTTALGEPPTEWFLVVKILLGVAAGLFCTWLAYRALHDSRREDAIAREAGAALQALEQGADFRNVIVNAYLRMLQIVKEEQGIEREDSVTPREFETLLTARGIAEGPIRQITRLFEKARYGSRAPDPADEQAAIACLTAIRAACLPGGRAQ
ncbi:DUF4129 domain-containing protein, partial [bacterium]